MTEFQWADALDVVKNYTVKITTPGGYGTGFLIAKFEDIVGIATAWHVIEHATNWHEPIRIQNMLLGNTVMLKAQNRSIHDNPKRDSALIRFKKTMLKLPDETLPIIDIHKRQREGVEIGWCGFPGIVSNILCFFSGRISAWIDQEKSYLVDGVAINGVSGGPAFSVESSEGKLNIKLMGIVTAYISNVATGKPLPGVSLIRSINTYLKLFEMLKSTTPEASQDTKVDSDSKD